jgi:hypothetical protein
MFVERKSEISLERQVRAFEDDFWASLLMAVIYPSKIQAFSPKNGQFWHLKILIRF